MFFSFFKVVFYFHFAIFLSLFDIKLFDVKLYHAGISLKKKSFRFLSESYRDNLITLRIFKAIWLKSFDNTRAYIKLNNDSKEAIFDIHNSSFDIRIEYVQKLSKKDMGFFIAKSNLLFIDNYLQKALVLLYLIIVFIPVFFISIISKNKVSAPLFVQELIEAFNLLVLLKKEKIKKVHYFCIYERDANLCAYVLMKNGFIVNKIPSEVPLVFANKVIVANQLSFCFGYQQEEFFYYKDTMFIDSTQQWLPELFFKTPINILKSSSKNIGVVYEIGFFSRNLAIMRAIGRPHSDRLSTLMVPYFWFLSVMLLFIPKHLAGTRSGVRLSRTSHDSFSNIYSISNDSHADAGGTTLPQGSFVIFSNCFLTIAH